jgi:hypothetical protein
VYRRKVGAQLEASERLKLIKVYLSLYVL